MSPSDLRTKLVESLHNGIVFDHARQKFILVGRRFKASKPVRIVKARNVRITMRQGFLVSPRDTDIPVLVDSVDFVQDSQQVVNISARRN